MSDPIRASLRVDRQPSSLDPADAERCRASLIERIEAATVMSGGLSPTFFYLLDAHLDAVPLPSELRDVEREAFVAAAFRQIGDRPEVRRRFRADQAILPGDGGSRRYIALLEHLPTPDAPSRWWLAVRPFGEGALGAGTLHGAWAYSEGDDLDALPEPFRSWLDPSTATIDEARQSEEAGPSPTLRMTSGTIPEAAPLPTSAQELAAGIGQDTDPEIARSFPTGTTAFLLAGRAWERWGLGDLPAELADDAIRSLAARANANGIAVIRPMAVELNGTHHRGWAVIAEMDGDQVYRVRALTPGPDGGIVVAGPFFQRLDGFALHWLGVPPTGTFQLGEMLNVEDGFGNLIEPAEA